MKIPRTQKWFRDTAFSIILTIKHFAVKIIVIFILRFLKALIISNAKNMSGPGGPATETSQATGCEVFAFQI